MYIIQPDFRNFHSFVKRLRFSGKEAPMSPSPLMSPLADIVLSILEFLASPTGGRDIGRAFLHRIGLRGGKGKK